MGEKHRLNFPSSFANRIMQTFPDSGKQWLGDLPKLILECEQCYGIKITEPMENLTHNYVAIAKQEDNSEIIVKFGIPGSELENEINALEFMSGDGIVNLIDTDKNKGILLLEKLVPGEMLSSISDEDKAIKIASNVMKRIWKPIKTDNSFPTTQDWFKRLDKSIELPQSFSSDLVDRAHNVAKDLHDTMEEKVLLHGDLHHFNILSAERQPWLAIDPKGVIGERAYEIGALLRNPIPDIVTTMDTKRVLQNRIDLLVDQLEFERAKIIGWGFAQAVLAAVWALDANANDWELFLRCAEVLDELD